jgi:hypothetical protein
MKDPDIVYSHIDQFVQILFPEMVGNLNFLSFLKIKNLGNPFFELSFIFFEGNDQVFIRQPQ